MNNNKGVEVCASAAFSKKVVIFLGCTSLCVFFDGGDLVLMEESVPGKRFF